MITYIKYPVKEHHLEQLKISKFFVCDKIEKSKDFITVYPKVDFDAKGNVVYEKENKIGFYCKSMSEKDIFKFKGGFNIEKCTKREQISVARKWYFETGQDLPRKIKKKLIGTKNLKVK